MKNKELVMGVFKNNLAAEFVITHLERMGYNPKEVSVISKDFESSQQLEEKAGVKIAGGAASGAAKGAILSGMTGVLVGISTIIIPEIGPVMVAGPLAAAMGGAGARAGAAVGGIIGALAGIGVSKEKAGVYEEKLKQGNLLVAVPVHPKDKDDASDIMEDFGATDIGAFAIDSPDYIFGRENIAITGY